jgi:hypothetical protein
VATAVGSLAIAEHIRFILQALGLVVLEEQITQGTTRCRLDVQWSIISVCFLVFWEPLLWVECLGLRPVSPSMANVIQRANLPSSWL